MADSSTSSTSSTSQSALKTRKPSHFRAKIKVQNIQIVVRNLHQNTIKLSVKNLKKKQSNNTQRKFIKIPIVSAICLILNQKNEKRFREQIYCLPSPRYCGSIGCKLCIFSISFLVSQFLQSMALSDHPRGEFISPKTKKEFRVEAYPCFIPFIDRKKIKFASIYFCSCLPLGALVVMADKYNKAEMSNT
ncbi:hypothetical protein AHAS_Ahas08G0058700 [Arachis hypogaea]